MIEYPQISEVTAWAKRSPRGLALSWKGSVPDPGHELKEALPGQPEPECSIIFSDLWSIGHIVVEVPVC